MDEKQRRASEAKRLLNEPLLAEAFETVRLEALVALSEVNATDTGEILRLQARANCLSDVLDALKAVITASGSNDGGMSAESEPTA